jgi:hypothetical protein
MNDMNTFRHHDDIPSDMSAAEEIQDLRFHLNGVCEELDIKDKIIMRLVAERDEARLELCDMKGTTRWSPYFPISTPQGYAEIRGWNCYKRKTAQTPNSMADLCGWDAFENM